MKLGVTDNGSGMTEAVKRRAFDMFFTTKPRGLGTGLGLALVRKVVDRAGGTVEIESEAGKGTTILMNLPIVQHARSSNNGGGLGRQRSGCFPGQESAGSVRSDRRNRKRTRSSRHLGGGGVSNDTGCPPLMEEELPERPACAGSKQPTEDVLPYASQAIAIDNPDDFEAVRTAHRIGDKPNEGTSLNMTQSTSRSPSSQESALGTGSAQDRRFEQRARTPSVRVLCVDDHAVLVEGLVAQFAIDGRIECVGYLPSAADLLDEASR